MLNVFLLLSRDAPPSEEDVGSMQKADVKIPPAHLRVLVAEDNTMNQRVIQSLLMALGYEHEIVENGKEAVHALMAHRFDIVLMDISMPVMCGETATRVVRAMDDEIKNTPIVAVTAHAMKGDKERFLSAGFTDYLSKPIDVSSLSSLLEKYQGASKAVA